MHRIIDKIIAGVLIVVLSVGCIGTINYNDGTVEGATITVEQENAIEMLNYMSILTYEINQNKNNRICLEDIRSKLLNNTYPNAIDSKTLNHVMNLLNTIENYRMIDVKRERLEYLYEQNKADSILKAIPNPVSVLSLTQSTDLKSLIGSVIYIGLDSIASYNSSIKAAEREYIEKGWELTDEEEKAIFESQNDAFNYMVSMVNDNNLPGELSLTLKTIEDFAKYKNDDNVVSRIRFLNDYKKVYKSYGGYWLTLAESYYRNSDNVVGSEKKEQYKKCINALKKYEKRNVKILRYDHDYANVIPLAIASAKEIYSTEKYVKYAAKELKRLLKNIDSDDWALRFFAAQTYVDLYSVKKDLSYLQKAYELCRENVNNLKDEQYELNEIYLSEVVDKPVTDTMTNKEKDEIKEYNDVMKEVRKTELPPIYEPLLLNCDLLFALSNKMGISTEQKSEIEKIMHFGDKTLFLTRAFDDNYKFSKIDSKTVLNDINIILNKSSIIIPAQYLSDRSMIKLTVIDPDGTQRTINDWNIKEVRRKTENDLSSFEAEYFSENSDKFAWKEGQTVTVGISCMDGIGMSYQIKYNVKNNKQNWYDHLKFWESEVLFERQSA